MVSTLIEVGLIEAISLLLNCELSDKDLLFLFFSNRLVPSNCL